MIAVSGCAGTPQSVPLSVVQADQQLDSLGDAYAGFSAVEMESAVAALQGVLSVYESYDDRERQWRANFTMANWLLAQNNKSKALAYAVRAEQLAQHLENKQKRYASLIQLGQLTSDSAVFEKALSLTTSARERALALTLLGRFDKVEPLLNQIEARNDVYPAAYIYYRYALATDDADSAEKALGLYRRVGNHYGVVDSLFFLATLSSDHDTAVDYAERALRSAQHLLGDRRFRSIQEWLKNKVGSSHYAKEIEPTL